MRSKEGQIDFHFGGVWTLCKYDRIPKAQGKKNVDYVVEETDRMLLIEVKDPSKTEDDKTGQPIRRSSRPASQSDAKTYVASLKSDLVAKCVDTAKDLHPLPRGTKAAGFLFVALIELEKLQGLQRNMLELWRQQIDSDLSAQFATNPPLIHYAGCVVCDLRAWNQHFPQYRAHRRT